MWTSPEFPDALKMIEGLGFEIESPSHEASASE